MNHEKIYAVYDYDTWIGDYLSSDAAKLLGAVRTTITEAARNGHRVRRRYRIVVVDTALRQDDPLLGEWDEVSEKVKKLIRTTEFKNGE